MANSIVGDSGNNFLYGSWGDDRLEGLGGADNLMGMDGNDTLIGGAGNDTLEGGPGNDTFVFNRGDGQDVLGPFGALPGTQDRLLFGDGIAPADLSLKRLGSDLSIELRGTTDRIMVPLFFGRPEDHNGVPVHPNGLGQIVFADGMQWNRVAILTRVALDTAPLLALGDQNNFYQGGGNLDAGAGNDTVDGYATYVNGGIGDDVLRSGGGPDGAVLLGGAGNDELRVGYGDALFDGGSGDDSLYGGSGNNTYVFSRGWGQDRLQLNAPQSWEQVSHSIVLSDLLPGAIALARSEQGLGNDLLITLRGTGDSLVLADYFLHRGTTTSITFADGNVWGAQQINEAALRPPVPEQNGGSADDNLYGGWENDVLSGGDGNDNLQGMDGNDVLIGGNGNDFLSGGNGDDTLIPGAGFDHLEPGKGSNMILFGRENGQVVILPGPLAETSNTIMMAADVLPADVSVSAINSYQVLVSIAGSAATMRLDLVPEAGSAGPAQLRVPAQMQFTDGTRWDSAKLMALSLTRDGDEGNNYLEGYPDRNNRIDGKGGDDKIIGGSGDDLLSGSDGNDTLHGDSCNDTLDGGAGDDILVGGAGNDLLRGGKGNDYLEGGAGNDIYAFALGDGVALVNDVSLDSGAANVLRFGDGIKAADLRVVAAGPEQHLYYGASGQIKLFNGGAGFGRIEFADGTSTTIGQLGRHAPVLQTPLNDAGASAGKLFTMQVKPGIFTDADVGDVLTYKATRADGGALPAWLKFDAASATFSGTPGGADAGTFDVLVTATDSTALSATDVFRMTVAAPNVAPTVRWPVADWTISENTSFYKRLPTFEDANPGDVLTVTVTSADGRPLPSWIAHDIAQDGITGSAGYDSAGTYAIKATATDKGGLSVSDIFNLTVTDVNRTPVLAKALPDAGASAGTAFALTLPAGSFTDPDKGDALALTATLAGGAALPQWLRFDPASASFSGTPGSADAGSVDVLVTATDSKALSAIDTFRITVAPLNVAPTVRWPAGDITLPEGYGFSKRLPTFEDANPGDVLSITVTSADGSALPSWIARDIPQDGITGSAGYDSAGTYGIKATATDKGGLSVSSIFNVIVTDVNRTPVLATPLPDAAASAGTAFALAVPAATFTDPDKGETLALGATLAGGAALPQWLRFDPATATFSGTPGHADSGVLDIAVKATDKGALAASDVFRLSVADVNVAPLVAAASAGATVTEGEAFSVAVPVFTDPNPNDAPAITVTRADGSALPSWMTYDPATGKVGGTAGQRDSGTYQLKATATDKGGLTAASEFAIVVLDANHAPVLTKGLPDFSAVSEHIFGLTLRPGMFTDPDSGDVVTVSASLAGGAALPSWLKFVPHAPGSGSFTGFPTSADVGSYDLVITGTDKDGLATSDSARLTIDQNLAPVYASGGDGATVAEGASLYLRPAAFTDPNQFDALTLSITRADGSALPSWMSYDVGNNYLTGTAGFDDSGTYALKVTATDLGGLTASHPFDVTVTNTNRAPTVAAAIADAAASAGSAFTHTVAAGTFADPDGGDALVLGATLAGGAALPQWLRFDAASGAFSGTPGHLDAGTIDVLVSATDSGGLSASDTFRLVTADVNVAPTVAAASAGASVAEGATFSVKVPVFQDANPGDTLAIAVTRADGSALPAWMAYEAASGAVTGNAGYSDSGVYALSATATDKAGLSVSSPFTLSVTNTNRAPVLATPLAAKSTMDNVAFSYSVPAATFTDPDAGDSGAYSASALPAWLSFNAATRTFSGTPALGDAGTSNVIVRYTDAGGLAATATLALTVNKTASVNLTGTAGDDILTGKSNNDSLTGLDGNDRLDGGLGADTMAGGRGNDSYVVDQAGDVVNEAAGAGTDSVASSIGYTLPANVENLTLTGSAAINGSGNTLNNVLTGNGGANVLNGGVGADSMAGNGGDDIYYVDNTGDVVTEWANGGFDQLFSSVTRTLANNAEVLTLTGTLAINGTGNAGNNLIQGNSAANSLNGGIGYDILVGGAGNDRLSDSSNESNLFHAGTGADTLFGGVAKELFIGGTGNDNIDVQTGVDIIAFNKGDGQDLVQAYGGNDDTLSLGHGIAYADLALKKVGTDLVLMMGAGDQITFRYWFEARGGSVSTLQVITAGGADYQPGSASAIHDNKVELFDFAGLVGQFNQARSANPSLTSWNMAQSMAAFSRGGSDTAAIGGDLAYHYAVDGDLAAVGMNAGLAIIGSAAFGSGMQTLLAGSALVDGSPMLY